MELVSQNTVVPSLQNTVSSWDVERLTLLALPQFPISTSMPRKSHFEQFQDHTRLKHFLLDAYLKQWAAILIKGLRRAGRPGPRVWFIDAFAGAGRDATGQKGSPVIAAEIASAINTEHFQSPLDAKEGMRVVAIEADQDRFKRLQENMQSYNSIAFTRSGTLARIADGLLRYVGNDPAFYFLDPFGVDGLDAALLPRILQGPRTEVLLLFSDEGAVRLAGKAEAVVPTRDELLENRRRKHGPSVFGEDDDAALEEQERAAVDRVLAGHQSNSRANEILCTAFGGDHWRAVVENTPPEWRREAFVSLYEDVLRKAGATHVLRFAITTESGRHKYTMMHASKNVRAFAAMKDAMHRTRGRRRKADEAPTLFETAPDLEMGTTFASSGRSITEIAEEVTRRFAGRTVRWRVDEYNGESIQNFARDETPLFLHEFAALQAELERRGYADRKQNGKLVSPLTFSFPEGR
jgi:three-Cys-motif partner protein